jgi:hypothetical protein
MSKDQNATPSFHDLVVNIGEMTKCFCCKEEFLFDVESGGLCDTCNDGDCECCGDDEGASCPTT